MDKALKRSGRYLAFSGVAAIVFGAIVLIWPGISLVALTALSGAFALVYGALAVASGLNLLAHKSTDWVPFVLGAILGGIMRLVAAYRIHEFRSTAKAVVGTLRPQTQPTTN